MDTLSLETLSLVSLVFFNRVAASGENQPRNTVIQLSGKDDLDQWSTFLSNGLSLLSSGLIAAVLVTGALYLVGAGQLLSRRRTDRRAGSHSHHLHHQYGDRRQEGALHQIERIISFLSVESLQDLVSDIKHEILGSLSSVRDDGLQRVDEATNVLNNEITDTLDSVGGGGKVEDCLLQAICYLTPGEEETEAGESRKNKEKQKRKEEKRKEKKKKKAKKNKNKNKEKEKEDENDYFDDYEEDYVDDEDDYEDEANTEEEESDGKIEEEDCDVFQCDIVRYGYQAFQLYGKVQTLRQQFDSLSEK